MKRHRHRQSKDKYNADNKQGTVLPNRTTENTDRVEMRRLAWPSLTTSMETVYHPHPSCSPPHPHLSTRPCPPPCPCPPCLFPRPSPTACSHYCPPTYPPPRSPTYPPPRFLTCPRPPWRCPPRPPTSHSQMQTISGNKNPDVG